MQMSVKKIVRQIESIHGPWYKPSIVIRYEYYSNGKLIGWKEGSNGWQSSSLQER